MFRNKTQRNRWLGILSLALGLHVLLGYLWLKHAPKMDAATSVSADMSVGVRSSSAVQAESAEQSGDSAPIARADVSAHKDGLHTENVEHITQKTTQQSTNQSKDNSTGNSINSTAAQTSARSDVNASEQSSAQSIDSGAGMKQTKPVDCTATQKSADTQAGLDVRVRVERTADGRAMFLGLVNQQGEARYYVRELKQGVQSIRFVSQDEQCVGVKATLTVRIFI